MGDEAIFFGTLFKTINMEMVVSSRSWYLDLVWLRT
jgi:hypothetical protein